MSFLDKSFELGGVQLGIRELPRLVEAATLIGAGLEAEPGIAERRAVRAPDVVLGQGLVGESEDEAGDEAVLDLGVVGRLVVTRAGAATEGGSGAVVAEGFQAPAGEDGGAIGECAGDFGAGNEGVFGGAVAKTGETVPGA